MYDGLCNLVYPPNDQYSRFMVEIGVYFYLPCIDRITACADHIITLCDGYKYPTTRISLKSDVAHYDGRRMQRMVGLDSWRITVPNNPPCLSAPTKESTEDCKKEIASAG